MSLKEDNELNKLQNLVKSSLLEINKLKLKIVQIEAEKDSLKETNDTTELESIIVEKNDEITNLVSEVNKYKQIIQSQTSKIEALSLKIDDLNKTQERFEDLKSSFENDLTNFKNIELKEVKDKLQQEISLNSDKEEEIKQLNQKLINSQDDVLKLSKELDNFKNVNYAEIKNKLEDSQDTVKLRDEEIRNISKSLILSKDKCSKLEFELNDFKNNRFTEIKIRLDKANETIDDKNLEIKSLNNKINEYKEEIANLNSNLISKDSILSLKREIDSRDLDLSEKEIRIKNLKEQSVPKEDYIKVQQEISEKDAQIKRLQEVKTLLQDINSDPVFDKEKIKQTILSGSDKTSGSDVNEIAKLRKELNETKDDVRKLENIKDLYSKLTAPRVKNLTSIQSQVFNILPNKSMTTYEIQQYVNDVAFDNLSFGNITNILKSIERKGYLKSEKLNNDEISWIKLEKN